MNNENYENKLKDQEIEEKISLIVKNLERKEPPFNLWSKIVQKINLEIGIEKKNEVIKSKSVFDWLFTYRKYAVGFTIICVIVVFIILLLLHKRDTIVDYPLNITQKNDSLFKINERKEVFTETSKNTIVNIKSSKKKSSFQKSTNFAYYEKKIEELTPAAEKKKDNLDPYVKSLYNERLANLDESINEIKSGLDENGLNKFIKKSLVLAYGEKVNVLLKIINN